MVEEMNILLLHHGYTAPTIIPTQFVATASSRILDSELNVMRIIIPTPVRK
jgi:hypothetical protein